MLQIPFRPSDKADLLEQLPEVKQLIPVFTSSNIDVYLFQTFRLQQPVLPCAPPIKRTLCCTTKPV